jgi:hypothetical protein
MGEYEESYISRNFREYFGLSEDWRPCIWTSAHNGNIVEVWKCPLKTRGPNRGHPNWSKATEKRTYLVTGEASKAVWRESIVDRGDYLKPEQ